MIQKIFVTKKYCKLICSKIRLWILHECDSIRIHVVENSEVRSSHSWSILSSTFRHMLSILWHILKNSHISLAFWYIPNLLPIPVVKLPAPVPSKNKNDFVWLNLQIYVITMPFRQLKFWNYVEKKFKKLKQNNYN